MAVGGGLGGGVVDDADDDGRIDSSLAQMTTMKCQVVAPLDDDYAHRSAGVLIMMIEFTVLAPGIGWSGTQRGR